MKNRRFIPVAIALVAVIAVSGVAYAYWTSSGSGTATGSTAAGVSVTVNAAPPALNAMYPGDSAQTTHVTVTNGSGQSVHVTTVSISDVTTDKVGCGVADFSPGAAVTPWGAGGTDIAAGVTTAAVAGPTIQFNNRAVNQNVCQSAVVTVHFSVA